MTFETLYVALSMQVLPRLFKLLPWVDLDTFYAKVKFDDIGFCMGRSENYFFFWKLLQPLVSKLLEAFNSMS